MLRSQLCSAASLRSPALRAWAERLRPMKATGGDARDVMLHRKMWEWLFIAEALRERGMLAAGRGVRCGAGAVGRAVCGGWGETDRAICRHRSDGRFVERSTEVAIPHLGNTNQPW